MRATGWHACINLALDHNVAELRLTSCMAAHTDFVCREIAAYVSRRLSIAASFVGDMPWPERERQLDAGDIQAGWICGLPYVRKADQIDSSIELLVAPVMGGARYQNRPIYFSDVVVHRDSPFQTFADLQGATWAYNEPGSQSGYNVTRYYLARLGHTAGYFGRVVRAGSHQAALQMVLNGHVNASAIDSTVLDFELQRQPEFAGQIHVVDTFGSSPIPPWVIQKSVPKALKQALRQLLVEMGEEKEGQAILAQWGISRFVAVSDSDYNPIREMAQVAEQVNWGLEIRD